MVTTNNAAWLTAAAIPLEIKSAPYTPPESNEIVIKTAAIAINPFDTTVQALGTKVLPWLKFPMVIGSDVAGEVIEVGQDVTSFQQGDRVIGNATGTDKRSNRLCEGGFQEFVVLRVNMVSHIPDSLAYENACVLPLCTSTAATALFTKGNLALNHPKTTTLKGSTNQTLLIWGGSTAVGSNAIQFAVAAGYDVITTASPTNFAHMRSLGATDVFDYHSSMAVQGIIVALSGKQCAGAVAIGDGSVSACIDIIAASTGRKFVAQISLPKPAALLPSGMQMAAFWEDTYHSCFRRKSRAESKELSRNLCGALRDGKYVVGPSPLVAGHGLESLEDALTLAWKGVPGKKVVVTL